MSRSVWKLVHDSHHRISINSENYVKNRAIRITVPRVGKTYKVFNGIRWFNLQITLDRVNHLFGEFAPTRKRPVIKKKQKNKNKK